MSQTFVVTATLLNLRSRPEIAPDNIVAKLGQGQMALGDPTSSPAWLQVTAGTLQGFAASQFLKLSAAPAPVPAPVVAPANVPPEVHFQPSISAALNSISHRHAPLAALHVRPRLAGVPVATRVAELHQIVADLDVVGSVRYQPTTTQTYCNIYAYDFCYLAGVYLPRVWWTSKALLALAAGQPQEVVYDKTVRELTANALHRWLAEWGDDYGWQPCATMEDMQARANAGDVCLVTAERMDPGRSGHIVVVLPEVPGHAAQRQSGGIIAPLQSQAGRVNKAYFTSRWWMNPVMFRATGFWAKS